jgi:hypothetical protein
VSNQYRIRRHTTFNCWAVDEFVANPFCGHWHEVVHGSHDFCRAFVGAA